MFYGYRNDYGIGTRNADGERLGTLHVFSSRRERDAWVEADRFDGNWHRERIDSREARRELEALAVLEDMRPDAARLEPTGALIARAVLFDHDGRDIVEH